MAANGGIRNEGTILKSLPNTECLETVRVLHRTVVSLREALERSQSEANLLKSKTRSKKIYSRTNDLIEQLALENHVLRRKILCSKKVQLKMTDFSNSSPNRKTDVEVEKKDESKEQAEINIASFSRIDHDITVAGVSAEKSTEENKFISHKNKADSEESEEVDDIELIFTTDDTKAFNFQEELEPISDEDADMDDSKSEMNESENDFFQPVVRTHSVLVGTDISKCGVVGDDEPNVDSFSHLSKQSFNSVSERRVSCSEQRKKSKATNNLFRPSVVRSHTQTVITRPALHYKNNTSVRESEAQTDISAVPPHWKSESFLSGTKENQNLPTLPSKFLTPFKPPNIKYPLKLQDKTQEARRVLLSDISFTSMVPELSRSVDHLCHNETNKSNVLGNTTQASLNPAAMKYQKGQPLLSASSSYSSKFEVNISNSNWNSFENAYIADQDRSTQDLLVRRRQSWRPSMHSLDMYPTNRTSSVPPSPTMRRHSAAVTPFSPGGNSDSHFYYPLPSKFSMRTASNITLKNSSSSSVNRKLRPKVSFRESMCSKNAASRQSLPNMHLDTESTEDSTESLIDESEECVRKTIDTTLTLVDWPRSGYRYVNRTYSVPNLFLEFSPPLSARPFIARTADDLKVNYFVKVINKDGRIVGGRIKFIGILPGDCEPYVGILLPPSLGETDGKFQGLRLFTCEKNCSLFVPFRKVVMAWKV